MLRLPQFKLEEPTDVAGAAALLAEHGSRAMVVAGGTDLWPNMKHGLFEPEVVVSLNRIEPLKEIRVEDDGTLVVGATVTLATLSTHAEVIARAPVWSQAASLVAGPQLRTMGTAGGNVMLDTRCQWYNQTHFWRKSLGYCLKKDGTVCHVVQGGRKCVAAASNDTAPALMALGASLRFESSEGRRDVPIDELWKADGIWNKQAERTEILTEIRVPAPSVSHRSAYGKLRDRGSIDFPLFGCAARLDLDGKGAVEHADLVCIALGARPVRIKQVAEQLAGVTPGTAAFEEAARRVAEMAYKRTHPLDNIPGDAEYRREMVPVYVRRTLLAAGNGEGPVHHV